MGNQFKNVAVIACLKTFLFVFNVVFWVSVIFMYILFLVKCTEKQVLNCTLD